MTGHAPKTAALLALHEGRLSNAGRRRVERHLSECPRCLRELAAIRTYGEVVEEARSAPPAALDWTRIEQAVLA
ncbi:MAG: zf-HC2 domain-containing protein, partial [Myxococcota bacterium]